MITADINIKIQEHIHSCPFCFHQHLAQSMPKDGRGKIEEHNHNHNSHNNNNNNNAVPLPCAPEQEVHSHADGHGVHSSNNGQIPGAQPGTQMVQGGHTNCAHGQHPHHHHAHPRPHGGCGSGPNCNAYGNGWHCCVHSHYMYCDHFPESTREKLQEKLRSRLTNRARGMCTSLLNWSRKVDVNLS